MCLCCAVRCRTEARGGQAQGGSGVAGRLPHTVRVTVCCAACYSAYGCFLTVRVVLGSCRRATLLAASMGGCGSVGGCVYRRARVESRTAVCYNEVALLPTRHPMALRLAKHGKWVHAAISWLDAPQRDRKSEGDSLNPWARPSGLFEQISRDIPAHHTWVRCHRPR